MNSLRIKEIMIRTISLAVLFLSLSAIGAFGQEKLIEKKQLEEILKKSWDSLSGKKYRSTNLVEKFSDKSKPTDDGYELIYENIPPERSRNVFITRNGGTVLTNEHIKIGPRNYYRSNGGEWSEESMSGAAYGSGGSSRRTYESYKIIEKTKFANEKVTVYEAVTKDSKYLSGDSEREEISTKRYWVNSKGLILKIVTETEIVGKKEFSRSTTTYDFDGKFQIEAPIP